MSGGGLASAVAERADVVVATAEGGRKRPRAYHASGQRPPIKECSGHSLDSIIYRVRARERRRRRENKIPSSFLH